MKDRKILLGIGIGLVIGCIFLGTDNKILRENQIEEKARDIGMHYENECKVLLKGDDKK